MSIDIVNFIYNFSPQHVLFASALECKYLLNYAMPSVWADADTWFERQQQEEEMQRLQAEHRAAMQTAEELHRKKMAEEREGEKEDGGDIKDDPMAQAEAEVLRENESS